MRNIFQFMVFLQENLVESKHHKLARSLRSGPSDHDLKPNAATRDQLNVSNKQSSFYLGSIHTVINSNSNQVRLLKLIASFKS